MSMRGDECKESSGYSSWSTRAKIKKECLSLFERGFLVKRALNQMLTKRLKKTVCLDDACDCAYVLQCLDQDKSHQNSYMGDARDPYGRTGRLETACGEKSALDAAKTLETQKTLEAPITLDICENAQGEKSYGDETAFNIEEEAGVFHKEPERVFIADDEPKIKISIKGPKARDIKENYQKALDFAQVWLKTRDLQVETTVITTKLMGSQTMPKAVIFEDNSAFALFIGKSRAYEKALYLLSLIVENYPRLILFAYKKAKTFLNYLDEMERLLSVVSYVKNHKRPGIYLRELDLPCIDTKFIEHHQGILGELLDEVLEREAIDEHYGKGSDFARRYGFLDKPGQVRFRLLDPSLRLPFIDCAYPDVTLDEKSFAALKIEVKNVIVVENEISFLSLKACNQTMAIFGAGYGFRALKKASWLKSKKLIYWGDLDTHGLAILREFRLNMAPCPVTSIFMDYATLERYKVSCVEEPKPRLEAALSDLTEEEALAYRALYEKKFVLECPIKHLRLEQEMIPWKDVELKLKELGLFIP